MFDYKHYVPIVRWKAGERIALRELYDEDKAGLTPLIEIPPDNIETALNKKISLAAFASQLRDPRKLSNQNDLPINDVKDVR